MQVIAVNGIMDIKINIIIVNRQDTLRDSNYKNLIHVERKKSTLKHKKIQSIARPVKVSH